jgi:DNA (cytosine-5)-methyltransferase 1
MVPGQHRLSIRIEHDSADERRCFEPVAVGEQTIFAGVLAEALETLFSPIRSKCWTMCGSCWTRRRNLTEQGSNMLKDSELIVDSFAGGGGASVGIEKALGRPVDIAINHNADAIAMHAANHPRTRHLTEDVWKVSPKEATAGRSVGLLWASPDCKHFSRAKGSKPVEKKIRSLAWIVVRWVLECSPRIIVLENVREFEEWGPLLPRQVCRACGWKGTEGQTLLARKRRRCPECESLNLTVTEELVPDPKRKGLTFRKFVGRLKGLGYSVQWRTLDAADFGSPTHRRRLFMVCRNDGEPIQWPEPTHADPKKIDGPGLFGQTERPWRTAAECIDWSIPCPSIFDRKRPLAEKTLKRIALGIKRYVLDNPRPFLVNLTHTGERRNPSVDEPLPTVTTAHRGEYGVIAPTLINCANGDKGRWGNGALDIKTPINTIHSGGKNFALVSTFIAKHFGDAVGTTIDRPLPTTTTRGTQNQIVAANLVRFNHDDAGVDIERPAPSVTTNNHAALVYSFLIRYFGTAIGQHVTAPLYTVTGKDRFGLVTVMIDGELFVIVDIGMRMLTPRELARCQGLDDSFILTGTKTSQVARIGNMVCPQPAEAIIRANCCAEMAEHLKIK